MGTLPKSPQSVKSKSQQPAAQAATAHKHTHTETHRHNTQRPETAAGLRLAPLVIKGPAAGSQTPRGPRGGGAAHLARPHLRRDARLPARGPPSTP